MSKYLEYSNFITRMCEDMLHERFEIKHEQETATLLTYVLDNSPKIDPNRKRPMIVICPGGGYVHTSDREGEPVAIRMNAMGYHACVLRYSVEPAVFPAALCQLARVIEIFREQKDEWNVDTGQRTPTTLQPEVTNWIEMAGRWIKGL